MKTALYARVSLDEADPDGRRYQEPENQLEPLREWASRMGWVVVGEYVDRGSGADANRPEFKRLLNDAMQLRFKAILVWRWDRFSREQMFVAVGRVQKLRERGVALMSLQESWLDTRAENPMSDITLSILSWASAEERKRISDRTKAGIARRRRIGQWKGGRPQKCRECGLMKSGRKKPLCECDKRGGAFSIEEESEDGKGSFLNRRPQ